jgi:hypothetical protein
MQICCCTLARWMIQVRRRTFHDREAPPEATTALLVNVTVTRATRPA